MYAGLLIFGFGGHARSVADIALALGVQSLCFIDANAKPGEHFLGHPALRTWDNPLPSHWGCIAAAGDNRRRAAQIEQIEATGWPLATLIAPTATTGAGATIGAGSVIFQHAHIGPLAAIGKGVIVNTGAVIEHECVVGDHAHVSINASIAGRSKLGAFSFLGAGATIIDGVTVSSGVTIGAGAVVVKGIDTEGTYVGVPAQRR